MTDKRTALINQIKEHTDNGATFTVIPSIPGVFDVVASRTADEKSAPAKRGRKAKIGLRTVRSVSLSAAELEPFERTAALLAYLLVPEAKAHRKRIDTYETICWLAANMHLQWPSRPRRYTFRNVARAATLNGLRRLYRHRQAATVMAFPYLLRDVRYARNDIVIPTRYEMAEEVADLAREGEPKNVEHRVWGSSLPVLHLAFAVATLRAEMFLDVQLRLAEMDQLDDPSELRRFLADHRLSELVLRAGELDGLDFMLLFRDDLTDRLLGLAEHGRENMPFWPTMTKAAERSIRFSLRPG